MNNLAELQLLPMMEFSLNTLPRKALVASFLKYFSDLTVDVFFVRKGVSKLKYNAVKITSNCFYRKKLELLEKHRKRTAEATPKIEKNIH